MLEIEKLDDQLYVARYGLPKVGDANAIWEMPVPQKPLIQARVQN